VFWTIGMSLLNFITLHYSLTNYIFSYYLTDNDGRSQLSMLRRWKKLCQCFTGRCCCNEGRLLISPLKVILLTAQTLMNWMNQKPKHR
jgi:hypothetical protein